jgi:hypothetical protein
VPPQHVVYARWVFEDSDGGVVGTSQVFARAVN